MIKAVIFDCFGVLVGTGFWNVYSRLSGDVRKDAAFIDDLLRKADSDTISSAEFHRIAAARLGISVESYELAFTQDETPNQPVFSFIRSELKPKYKIGLVSNASSGTIQRKIPPDLLQLFDAVVVSGEAGLLKPYPAIFRLTAERLGVAPEEAVFTDDHAEYLSGAEAVGMRAILYKGLDDFKRHLAAS